MGDYRSIKSGIGSRKRYADGGRVSKAPAKTVINIVTPQAAAPAGAPPVPPMGNSPSPQAAPPVPPAAAQMAINQMKPGAFRNGGTVPQGPKSGKGLTNAEGGAQGGKGRLAKSREAKSTKHVGYANGGNVLKAKARNKLPKSDFGMPGERKYPMPDRAHAANAKARASQMVAKGKLSPSAKAKIDAKANRKLGE